MVDALWDCLECTVSDDARTHILFLVLVPFHWSHQRHVDGVQSQECLALCICPEGLLDVVHHVVTLLGHLDWERIDIILDRSAVAVCHQDCAEKAQEFFNCWHVLIFCLSDALGEGRLVTLSPDCSRRMSRN